VRSEIAFSFERKQISLRKDAFEVPGGQETILMMDLFYTL
jgi:hypothetical protein